MIIGIREMRCKDNGQRSTDDGHRVYHSRSADKHEGCIGFMVNNTVTNSVMGLLFYTNKICMAQNKEINALLIVIYNY